MTDPTAARLGGAAPRLPAYGQGPGQPAPAPSLADILERVLDKGVVIAGDIRINLLDIELLTIKLRLLVASVDKAKEMGIDWWEHDPSLSSKARCEQRPSPSPGPAGLPEQRHSPPEERLSLAEENERLRAQIAELRAAVAAE
jgi:hypothetical protein